MSDALNYLLRVRGEALGNYFAFLKQAGDNLEPKTRDIISVITKVDKQTEKGLKQYLKRALNDGVSAAEIIDALLLASPTLGMSKIVWAVDIILQMNLPEFEAERLAATAGAAAPAKSGWRPIADLAQVPEGVSLHESGGIGLLISRRGEIVNVFSNLCPHQGSWMTPEHLQGATTLVCPLHGWEFDIRNGRCLSPGGRALERREHKIEQDTLFVMV